MKRDTGLDTLLDMDDYRLSILINTGGRLVLIWSNPAKNVLMASAIRSRFITLMVPVFSVWITNTSRRTGERDSMVEL